MHSALLQLSLWAALPGAAVASGGAAAAPPDSSSFRGASQRPMPATVSRSTQDGAVTMGVNATLSATLASRGAGPWPTSAETLPSSLPEVASEEALRALSSGLPACQGQPGYEEARRSWCGDQIEPYACAKGPRAPNPIWDCHLRDARPCAGVLCLWSDAPEVPPCEAHPNYDRARLWCGDQPEPFACSKGLRSPNPTWDCHLRAGQRCSVGGTLCSWPRRPTGGASTTSSPSELSPPAANWSNCTGLNWTLLNGTNWTNCTELNATEPGRPEPIDAPPVDPQPTEPPQPPQPTEPPQPPQPTEPPQPPQPTEPPQPPQPPHRPWVHGTWTTGYWDCCKPSCSWSGKGKVDQPVLACSSSTGQILGDSNTRSVCDGGDAASCTSHQPFLLHKNLAVGFAAAAVSGNHGLTGDANCGQCYELRFVDRMHDGGAWGGAHTHLVNKTLVVQVTNIGYDVTGSHSFDIQIPGAGQGIFTNGCAAQHPGFSVGDFDCDNRYGGCHGRDGCARLPKQLQAGCRWRYDWFHWLKHQGQTNNPWVKFRRVRCPKELVAISGSTPLDDHLYRALDAKHYL